MILAQASSGMWHPIAILAFGICIASGLLACGGTSANTAPARIAAYASVPQTAPLTVTIRIPAAAGVASSSRSPRYISTAIAAIDFRLTGSTPTGR